MEIIQSWEKSQIINTCRQDFARCLKRKQCHRNSFAGDPVEMMNVDICNEDIKSYFWIVLKTLILKMTIPIDICGRYNQCKIQTGSGLDILTGARSIVLSPCLWLGGSPGRRCWMLSQAAGELAEGECVWRWMKMSFSISQQSIYY